MRKVLGFKSKTLGERATRNDVKTVSGARSAVHKGLWFRHESPVACVSEHRPIYGRVYLHVLFCYLFIFIGMLFDISLVSLKHLLQCVCEPRSNTGFDCLRGYLHFNNELSFA